MTLIAPHGAPSVSFHASHRDRLLGSIVLAGTLMLVAPAATAQTIAVVGGKVFPVSGPPIENGTVVIVDGAITAVGPRVVVPAHAQRIDARGKWVTPGLIDAASHLGLVDVDAVNGTDDQTARGDRGVAAAFRAWDALNPAEWLWTSVRNDGITNVGVFPGQGFIAGQAALVETLEGPRPSMIRRAPVGMVADFSTPSLADTRSRGELWMRLREVLEDARVYVARKDAFENAALRPLASGRLHLAALAPLLDGSLPLMLRVDRASDIEAALDVAREYSLKLVLLGGAEAWEMAPRLAAEHVPVFTGGLVNLPEDFEQLGARLENAALLRKAGVTVVLTAAGANGFRTWTLRQQVGNAIAAGLPWDEGLRSVTRAPAEVFGLEDRLGSLEPGREGTLVVWSGDPFEVTTAAEHVIVRGRESKGRSRQDLLTERYARPR
jgi:imidazolonepropionase-like amidohydrolase